MKTVFSNRMVAHVWAQQTQEHGRGSSFYFNGATIYSYGQHFPIASFMRGALLFNSEGYSSSTSKHISYTWRALSFEQRQAVIHVPTHILKDAIRIDGYTKGAYLPDAKTMRGYVKNLVEYVGKWIDGEVISAAKTAAKRRKKSLTESDINKAVNAADNARKLLALFKAKLPAKTEKALQELQTNLSAVLERNQKQIAAEKRKAAKLAKQREIERKKREAEIAALIPIAVEKWRKCETLDRHEREAMAQTGIIYLRVRGDNVETSRGAEFPVEHAKRAFTLIRRIKDNGEFFTRCGMNEAHALIKLGEFRIDEIHANGNVKAGCHFVEWPQIEIVARELNIFP